MWGFCVESLFLCSFIFLLFAFIFRFVKAVGPNSDDTPLSENDQPSSSGGATITLTQDQLRLMITSAVAAAIAPVVSLPTDPEPESEPVLVANEPIQTNRIDRIAFKPPQPLYGQNPVLWFALLEYQFRLCGIISERTKFMHALDSRLHDSFADLMMRENVQLPYSNFKAEVIRVLSSSDKTKLHNLLHGLTLGDRKPSQLLALFRSTAGDSFNESAIKQLWMNRLPQQVQVVLAAFERDFSVSDLAERADVVYETMTQSQVNSLSRTTEAGSSAPAIAIGNTLDIPLDQKLADFKSQIMSEISTLFNKNSRSCSKSQFMFLSQAI